MKKIVVAPFNYHKTLMSLYRKNVFDDVKFLRKEELLEGLLGKVDTNGIALLMKESGLHYQSLLEISHFIPFINKDSENPKIHRLFEYNKLLKQCNLLNPNEYFKYLFKNTEVYVHGYSKEDIELGYVFKELGVEPIFHLNERKNIDLNIRFFSKVQIEVLDVLNSIARLLDEGVNINDIYLYANDESFLFYLKNYYKDYGFNINFKSSDNIFSYELSKKFLSVLEDKQNFNEALNWLDEQEDSIYKTALKDFYKNNYFDFLTFEQQKDLFSNILKHWGIKDDYYVNAVRVIGRPILIENAHIFVPCFVQGSHPQVFKDDEYLNDLEKEEYNILTSKIKNNISLEETIVFLSSDNTFYLSFSKESVRGRYLVSPLIDLLHLNVVDYVMPSKVYSNKYVDYLYSVALDNYDYFGETSIEKNSFDGLITLDHNKYDNDFKKFMLFDDSCPLRFSYSSIKDYYECPFRFYVEKGLKIEDDSEVFAAKLGTFAHYILSFVYKKDFDFDRCVKEAYEKQTFSVIETVLLENVTEQIKDVANSLLIQKNMFMVNPTFVTEEHLKLKIDENTYLDGFADKIIVIDNKYVVLVDYKSSSEKFTPEYLEYGVSLQLPIYGFLVNNDSFFSAYDIGGLYINSIISKDLNVETKEGNIIKKHLQLDGITFGNEDFINKFDTSYRDGEVSQFIKGVSKKSSKNLYSKEQIDSYIDLAKEKIKEANYLIRNNEFSVSPLKLKSKQTCQFCPYKDICYRKAYQCRNPLGIVEESEDDEVV